MLTLHCATLLNNDRTVAYEMWVDVDETDFKIDDFDGTYDYRLIRLYGTNHTGTRTLKVFKKNGRPWFIHTFGPGGTRSVNAGGQIKYQSDIPATEYG